MTALERLQAHAPDPAPLDTAAPVLPEVVRDRDAATSAAKLATRRGWYRTKRFLVQLLPLLLNLVRYSPRGLGRLVKATAKWLYDWEGAEVRTTHARAMETREYQAADRIHATHMRSRFMVAVTLAAVVVGPVLCWYAPWWLGGIVGVLVFWWTVKLIPGKHWGEYVAAAVLGVLAWQLLPRYVFPLLPMPPAWVWPVLGGAAVLALGWYGRPLAQPLMKRDDPAMAGIPEKPTAPIVVDALVAARVQGLTDKNRDGIQLFQPGVARSRRGYHVAMNLPMGVTASDVMDRRAALAAAMRRELGTVWPKQGDKHPGHLELFLSDQAMNKAKQSPWPLAVGKPVDIFEPLPLFTNQEGQWVSLRMAYNQLVIGGLPGYGKTFAEREVGVALALDPRTRLYCFDGKGFGDLSVFRLVAHRFFEGDEPDELAEQLAALREIQTEMRRRGRFLRELPREECPENKVTSELVDRYPALAPIVVIVDETQVYCEADGKIEGKKVSDEFTRLFTDLVKRGRAAGIIPLFATQKPDADALPSGISDNCATRLCFRVLTAASNNQVLGNGMYAAGIRSTLFGAQDKGLAWLRGDGDEAQVVRSVHGLDAVVAEELLLKARATREAKGLLTGDAAGEEAADEAEQVSFLEDLRFVFANPPAKALHLDEIRTDLADARPATWGHLDNDALGAMLRDLGLTVRSVHSTRAKTSHKGVKAEDLDGLTATEDREPEGVVVDLTERL